MADPCRDALVTGAYMRRRGRPAPVAFAPRRGGAAREKTGAGPVAGQIIGWPYTTPMAHLLKLRLGVSEDPTAFPPSLNDCVEALLQQAELLMTDVLEGLTAAATPSSARRFAGFQQPANKAAILSLSTNAKAVCASYRSELARIAYEGGGKEQLHAELLRFEDLRLFEDAQLDQSIEVARAQQEVSLAVDDVLP